MWSTLCAAARRFSAIDGEEWSAAFAFHVLLSLFPLIVLTGAISSLLLTREVAVTLMVGVLQRLVPLDAPMAHAVANATAGVIDGRGGLSLVGVLIWSALGCFVALVQGVARASAGARGGVGGWRTTRKGLLLLAFTVVALLAGTAGPALLLVDAPDTLSIAAPVVVFALLLFGSVAAFYRHAPQHRPKRRVWPVALAVSVLIHGSEGLFFAMLRSFHLSTVYGALGGVVGLLLWVYAAGAVFLLGACVCAVRSDVAPVS